MFRRRLCTAIVMSLICGSLQAAEVIPGRWQLVDMLPAGSPVTIKTTAGEQVSCLYFYSDRESVLVVENQGSQRRIPKSIIESVVAEKYDDSIRNGALLGAAAGVGFAVIAAIAPGDMTHRTRVNVGTFGSVLFGLCGMGVGALLDFHHRGRELIYQAKKKADPPKQPVRRFD
jgi:hypothetical protein